MFIVEQISVAIVALCECRKTVKTIHTTLKLLKINEQFICLDPLLSLNDPMRVCTYRVLRSDVIGSDDCTPTYETKFLTLNADNRS